MSVYESRKEGEMPKRKGKDGIPAYPKDYVAVVMTAYTMVAKSAIRTGDAAGYRRASNAMHEATRTI